MLGEMILVKSGRKKHGAACRTSMLFCNRHNNERERGGDACAVKTAATGMQFRAVYDFHVADKFRHCVFPVKIMDPV
jgi:hypothetical protein